MTNPTMPEDDEHVDEVQAVQIFDGSTALTAVDRAAIDSQVATAKQYPRSITNALREAITLATLDEATAQSMFYALKRSGKIIPGPSVRLAEIMAYSWTNLRVDADIVAEDKTMVTAMGTCFDLEKNVAIRVRVKRRITDKNGRRFNEDMVSVTSNAAISIAVRNAVFKVVPRAYVDKVYAAAKTASLGKGGTMEAKRAALVDWFGKLGVKPEEVFAVAGVKGDEDIGEDELIALRSLANEIKDGKTTVTEAFRAKSESAATTDLNAALTPKPTTASAPAAVADQKPCKECGRKDGTHEPTCAFAD
jgi:hypothetical protein